MRIYKEVEISTDVEIDIDLDDVYKSLTSSEKEELLEMLLEHRGYDSRNYYIESIILGKSDSDVLTNKKVWDKIIKLIKYEQPALKDYIIEELQYEPTKI